MSSCTLAPSASAFSAMLSAFIGSVVNGISSGWFVAFMTGWISFFALFRVLVASIYMLYRSATASWEPEYDSVGQMEENSHPMIPQNSSHEALHDQPPVYTEYQNYDFDPNKPAVYSIPQLHSRRPNFLRLAWPRRSDVRTFKSYAPLNRDITILGWIGWLWTCLYAPISQSLWLAANVGNHNNGAAKLVKGLAVAVTALPLCFDNRVRYGEKLAGRTGTWAKHVFNLVNSLSCLLQGVICAFLLISGVIDLHNNSSPSFPIPVIIVYPLFALVWMFLSFAMLPVRDGGQRRASQKHWTGYFVDIGMGAFAGLFLAVPAFALWQSSLFDEQAAAQGFDFDGSSSGSSGLGLKDYLSCESVGFKKFAASFP